MAPLHDRMAVILPPVAWPRWLGEEPGLGEMKAGLEALLALLEHGGDDGFTGTVVSTRVNAHRNDDPACIEEAPPQTAAPEIGSLL